MEVRTPLGLDSAKPFRSELGRGKGSFVYEGGIGCL